MRKILFILAWCICNIYFAFAQEPSSTTFECTYHGLDTIPPCYIEDNDRTWKTSHGSPCYVTYQSPVLYNNLLLATNGTDHNNLK
jgi:hypothetical protein